VSTHPSHRTLIEPPPSFFPFFSLLFSSCLELRVQRFPCGCPPSLREAARTPPRSLFRNLSLSFLSFFRFDLSLERQPTEHRPLSARLYFLPRFKSPLPFSCISPLSVSFLLFECRNELAYVFPLILFFSFHIDVFLLPPTIVNPLLCYLVPPTHRPFQLHYDSCQLYCPSLESSNRSFFPIAVAFDFLPYLILAPPHLHSFILNAFKADFQFGSCFSLSASLPTFPDLWKPSSPHSGNSFYAPHPHPPPPPPPPPTPPPPQPPPTPPPFPDSLSFAWKIHLPEEKDKSPIRRRPHNGVFPLLTLSRLRSSSLDLNLLLSFPLNWPAGTSL